MSISPAPRPFAQNIQRHRREHHSRCNTPNNEEAVPHSLDGDPVIAVECQSKGEKVLDKVHDGEGLGRLLPVTVDDVRDNAGRAELDTEVDEAEADDDRDGPRVVSVQGLSPGEKAGSGEE